MSSGKGGHGDLWDDSVLIKAFNDAIFKYKKMHNMENNITSSNAENAISCKEDPPDLLDNAHDAERNEETHDETAIASNTEGEVGDMGERLTVKETSCLELDTPESHLHSSNGQYYQSEPTVHPNSRGSEEYNQLVNKYYELEDQRQKILQQLNQFGYGNYNFDYGTTTSEQHHSSASQTHWGPTGSLCPYGCQGWIAPCTLDSSCCFNKACIGKSCYAPAEAACSKDNDIVKTAKAAAERALASLKEQVCENQGKERRAETHGSHLVENTSSGTDLAEVLNAWYSAGFYTGKYLSEQSLVKK